jgi:hypothetical protein
MKCQTGNMKYFAKNMKYQEILENCRKYVEITGYTLTYQEMPRKIMKYLSLGSGNIRKYDDIFGNTYIFFSCLTPRYQPRYQPLDEKDVPFDQKLYLASLLFPNIQFL